MTHATAKRIEEEAGRYGFHLLRSDGRDGHRAVWQIICGYCPAQRRFYGWNPNTSPDLMVKNARQQGWKVGIGDKPECASCAHPKKLVVLSPSKDNVVPIKAARGALLLGAGDGREYYDKLVDSIVTTVLMPKNIDDVGKTPPKAETKKKENKMTDTMVETINAAYEIGKQPTPKIMRAVFEGLGAYFNEKTHLYTGGYSDLKLAKEIGTTEEVVARLRRESYGELAEDPLVTSLRNAITHLETKIAAQQRDNTNVINDLRSRVEQMSTRTKSK